MARPTRKFIVSISDNQHPIVTFEGDYINKRELDLCIRALKKKQREIIRTYRRSQIIAEHEASKKGQVTDDARRTTETESGRSSSEGASKEGRSTEPAKAAVAASVGGSNSSNTNSVSGLAGKVPGVTGAANPSGK